MQTQASWESKNYYIEIRKGMKQSSIDEQSISNEFQKLLGSSVI